MKRRLVTMPDGNTQIVELPEGASRDEVISKAHELYDTKVKLDAAKNTSNSDILSASIPGRFATGLTDPPVGAAQFGARALPGDSASNYMDSMVKERSDSIKRGSAFWGRDSTDIDWARMGGNAALGMMVTRKPSAGVGGRMLQGGGLGLGFGATAPLEDTENFGWDKTTQTLAGGVLGSFIPGAMDATKFGLKIGKHVFEPMFRRGKDAIKSREWMSAAGNKANDIIDFMEDKIPSAFRKRGAVDSSGRIEPSLGTSQRPGQIVPGSKPTAAEAAAPAGRAEFSALERDVAAHKPSDYLARGKEQQAAREASLATIAKTPKELKAAIATRGSNAEANYASAFKNSIKADPALARIANSDYFEKAVEEARKIARTENIDPKRDMGHFLHLVKRGLDKQLEKIGDGALGGEEKRAVQGVRKELIGWLGKNVPGYDKARTTFASDSKPINRMVVGQELEKVLKPPISDIAEVGKQRFGPFAASIRDSSQVIKKGGGDPRFGELKDILTPSEMKKVNDIASDLARKAQFEEQASAGMKARSGNLVGGQLERETGSATAPNALWRPAMLFNAVLRRMQGKANPELKEEMALDMLDPAFVAKVMRKAMIPRHRMEAFLGALNRAQTPIVAGSVSASSKDPDKAVRVGAGAASLLIGR